MWIRTPSGGWVNSEYLESMIIEVSSPVSRQDAYRMILGYVAGHEEGRHYVLGTYASESEAQAALDDFAERLGGTFLKPGYSVVKVQSRPLGTE